MFVGVNGSGKTTSIGKLTNKLGNTSKILVAACDTFRAAAVDQLKVWSEKDNVEVFQGELYQDPASIAFKACNKAIEFLPEKTINSVAASDAFFPFSDGVKVLINLGVKAIIQPGGSINDKEVIKVADKAGIVMAFTGTRHFKH